MIKLTLTEGFGAGTVLFISYVLINLSRKATLLPVKTNKQMNVFYVHGKLLEI